LEYWSIGKYSSRSIQAVKMIGLHLVEIILLNYINRANHYGAKSSKTRLIHLGLNKIQHSNTPVLQHSGTSLPAQPIISDLAQIARFSMLEQKSERLKRFQRGATC